ncbi:hypothetical protein B1H58_09610 [Pantoea alhagi]|uniref:Uncharacterized protein n=1 Tax=Pantoea alhagi TaxID=1891675 RepID=A0A1W6B587_9GAMM|nr:hypothetical protein [Pantoea alhagi]ARJ42244.1 hypothetical protein B1H58_09610 [Pantoea alhagi]
MFLVKTLFLESFYIYHFQSLFPPEITAALLAAISGPRHKPNAKLSLRAGMTLHEDIVPGSLCLRLFFHGYRRNFSLFISDVYYHYLVQSRLARRQGNELQIVSLARSRPDWLEGHFIFRSALIYQLALYSPHEE